MKVLILFIPLNLIINNPYIKKISTVVDYEVGSAIQRVLLKFVELKKEVKKT